MEKNKAFTVFMVLFTAALTFTAFEATARFYEEMDSYIVTKQFDPLIGWQLKPGRYSVRPSGKLHSVTLEINSYGLRGGEFPAAKPADERRVMFLGDSFVFARHFELPDTFTGRLEKIMNERGERTRVLNAGVPGYGTGQEMLLMKKLAETHGIVPDDYVLVVFSNDILDNLRLSYGNYDSVPIKPGFQLDASGKAVITEMPVNDLEGLKETFRKPENYSFWRMRSFKFVKESITSFFVAHPKLIRLVLRLGFKVKLPRKPGLLNGWYDAEVVNEGVPLMRALISDIKEEAVRRGASFRVVIVPSPVQIYPGVYRKILKKQFPGDPEVKGWIADPLRAQRVVGEICREIGVEYLDLYPALKAQSNRRLYLPRDGHFDAAAHEITAKALAEFIAAPSRSVASTADAAAESPIVSDSVQTSSRKPEPVRL